MQRLLQMTVLTAWGVAALAFAAEVPKEYLKVAPPVEQYTVCKKERVTGSNMFRRVCRKPSQARRDSENAQRFTSEYLRQIESARITEETIRPR